MAYYAGLGLMSSPIKLLKIKRQKEKCTLITRRKLLELRIRIEEIARYGGTFLQLQHLGNTGKKNTTNSRSA